MVTIRAENNLSAFAMQLGLIEVDPDPKICGKFSFPDVSSSPPKRQFTKQASQCRPLQDEEFCLP